MAMTKRRKRPLGGLGTAVAVLALVLWFFTAVGNLSRDSGDEGREQLETALRRSAVACYAAEGVYPPTLDYLKDHYGVQVDEAQYIVFYEIFASNLMPDITVLERGNG